VRCLEARTAGESGSYAWHVGAATLGTGQSFIVPASSYRRGLTCTAGVWIGHGAVSSATSAPSTVALGSALKATKRPKLSGAHTVGRRESVSRGVWSSTPTSYSYQWYAGHRKIRRATGRSLTLTKSERATHVSVRVTAHSPGYANGTARTRAVAVG
jgi:hypothetical protein